MQIYFDDKPYDKFKQIEKNIIQINKHFLDIAFETNPDCSLTQKVIDYNFFKKDIEKENTVLLKEINNLISIRKKLNFRNK